MKFDPSLFLSVFAVIFVAELPDKTAFATLFMATRKNPLAIFFGAAAAFTIQSLVAVLFGGVLGLLPPGVVRIGAGVMLLALSVGIWRRKEEEEMVDAGESETFMGTLWASFILIFMLEWGDFTQLATVALVAKHKNPFTIFAAATAALWTVSALAVIAGSRAKGFLNPKLLSRAAAVVFAAAGAAVLLR